MIKLVPDEVHTRARAGIHFVTIEAFETILDELCGAKEREVLASVDAGACRTDWDYRQAHEQHIAALEARDKALDELCQLLTSELAQARR